MVDYLWLVSIFGYVVAQIEGPTQASVDAHNEARAGENAGLPVVSWDEELYTLCIRNVEECNFGHDVTSLANGSPYGQNLYMSIGPVWTSDAVVEAAVQSWMDEKTDYNLDANTCASGKVCGHYTQVVWKSSVKIGCAVNHNCTPSTIVCCNYAPAGNYLGQKPYNPSDIQSAPVDGGVSTWGEWGSCSAPCGGGSRSRSRSCDNPAPQHGGLDCTDTLSQNENCNQVECPSDPIDGGVGTWGEWGSCSAPCGGGSRSRSRSCDSPAPQHGGQDCSDTLSQNENCNQAACSGPCGVCTGDGGTCSDSDGDGTDDVCGCPAGTCSSAMASGCDLLCATIGAFCSSSDPQACWDPNANCELTTDLGGRERCMCKFGYVKVKQDDQPIRCQRIIGVADDANCQSCQDNDGVCYDSADDDDSLKDGCVCPPTRDTASADCDTLLFDLECTAEGMTVCYQHHDLADHVAIFTDLYNGDAFAHAEGYKWDPVCQLERIGDDYCLALEYEDNLCGLSVREGSRDLAYGVELAVQKYLMVSSDDDIYIWAYCSYDRVKHSATGYVDVVGAKTSGAEGQHHTAVLDMALIDKDGNELTNTDIIIVGEEIKVNIAITDDVGGLFTSMRAEICIISDRKVLGHPVARSVPILIDGCPNGILESDAYVRPVNSNAQEIETGYFQTPKFTNAEYLFVHCAVRVCINDENCDLDICGSGGRRRRSLRYDSAVSLEYLTEALKEGMQHETARVRVQKAMDETPTDESAGMDENLPGLVAVFGVMLIILLVIVSVLALFLQRTLKANVLSA